MVDLTSAQEAHQLLDWDIVMPNAQISSLSKARQQVFLGSTKLVHAVLNSMYGKPTTKPLK